MVETAHGANEGLLLLLDSNAVKTHTFANVSESASVLVPGCAVCGAGIYWKDSFLIPEF